MLQSISFDVECLTLEYAKSNRSECKKCAQKIGKDELRISHTIYFDPEHFQRNLQWMHFKCFQMPPQFKDIHFYEIEQSNDIKPNDRKKIMKELNIKEGDESMVPNHAAIYKKEPTIEKFEDQKIFTNESDFKEFRRQIKKLESKTPKDLLELLRKNKQLMSAGISKDKLIHRVAECIVLGARQPYCPNCGSTNYRCNIKKGYYSCLGYLDDIDWYKCNTHFKTIKRVPWIE